MFRMYGGRQSQWLADGAILMQPYMYCRILLFTVYQKTQNDGSRKEFETELGIILRDRR